MIHNISGKNGNVQDEHVKTMTTELVVKPGEPEAHSAIKINALDALIHALKAQADRQLDYHKRSMASLDTAAKHLAGQKAVAQKNKADALAKAAKDRADVAAIVDKKIKAVEKEVHDKVVDLVAHASSPEHAVDESLKQVAHDHTKHSTPIVPPASEKKAGEKLAQTNKDE